MKSYGYGCDSLALGAKCARLPHRLYMLYMLCVPMWRVVCKWNEAHHFQRIRWFCLLILSSFSFFFCVSFRFRIRRRRYNFAEKQTISEDWMNLLTLTLANRLPALTADCWLFSLIYTLNRMSSLIHTERRIKSELNSFLCFAFTSPFFADENVRWIVNVTCYR